MKIEFDPISRTMRFLKFFTIALIAAVYLERILSDALDPYKIYVMNFYSWIIYYCKTTFDSIAGEPTNLKYLKYFWPNLVEWQNALALTAMLILSVAVALAADWFFLWYQRTHMQSK